MNQIEKSIPSNKLTSSVCAALLETSLNELGYELERVGSYYQATKTFYQGEDDAPLVILPINRRLSKNENSLVSASVAAMQKFLDYYHIDRGILKKGGSLGVEEFAELFGQERLAIPCIAFCICKYGYSDIEICVIPIRVLLEQSKSGRAFSVSEKSGSFNYDYAKLQSRELPEGVVLRRKIHSEL